MKLEPIHLSNVQDFNHLITHLQELNLIHIHTQDNQQKITSASFQELQKHCLKSSENDIYLLDDVAKYLQEADDKDIHTSTVTFITQENQSINLEQIKADINLLTQLQQPTEMIKFLQVLNLNEYTDLSLPPISTIYEITQTKQFFDNRELFFSIAMQNNSLGLLISMLSYAQAIASLSINEIITLPKALHYTDSIKFTIELLEITLKQQMKLKSALLEQWAESKHDNLDEINKWIKEINEDNAKIILFNQQLLAYCIQYIELAETLKSRFKHISTDDPTLEKTRKSLAKLTAEIKRIHRNETLKSIVVYTVLIGLPLLLLAALSIVICLLLPITLMMTVPILLGISLIALLITLFIESLNEGISTLYDLIDNTFTLLFSDQEQCIIKLQNQVNQLQNDLIIAEEFPKISKELYESAKLYNSLIPILTTNMEETIKIDDEIEKKFPSKEPYDSKTGSPADLGLFGRKRSQSEIEAEADKIQAQPQRSRSSSNLF